MLDQIDLLSTVLGLGLVFRSVTPNSTAQNHGGQNWSFEDHGEDGRWDQAMANDVRFSVWLCHKRESFVPV